MSSFTRACKKQKATKSNKPAKKLVLPEFPIKRPRAPKAPTMPLVSEEKWINLTIDTVNAYVANLKKKNYSIEQMCENLDEFINDHICYGGRYKNMEAVIQNFDSFMHKYGNCSYYKYIKDFTLQDILDMIPPGTHPKEVQLTSDTFIEGTYIQKNYNYYNELELYNIANKEYEIDKVNYNEKMKQWKADKMAFELTLANKLEKLKMEL